MEKKWFIHGNGKQEGPFSLEDVRRQLAAAPNAAQFLAWCEGMPTWKKVGEIPELKPPAPPVAAVPSAPSATPPMSHAPQAAPDVGLAPKRPAKSIFDGAQVSVKRVSESNQSGLAPDELSAFLELQPDQEERSDILSIEPAAKPKLNEDALQAEKLARRARKDSLPYGVEKPKGGIWKLLSILLLLGAGGAAFYYGGLYQKLMLMRFARIEDVAPEDYERLKKAASAGGSEVSVAVAFSKADPTAPTLYLASNQSEGTIFDVQLKGVAGTLLNAESAAVGMKLQLKNHLAVSPSVRLKTGGLLPVGKYQLEVSLAGDKADKGLVFQDKISILGTYTVDAYQAKMKEAEERIKARMKAEIEDLNTLVGAVVELIDFNQKAFKEADSIPIAKKKIVFWQRSKDSWAKRDAYFADRFSEKSGPWTEEVMKKRFFNPQIFEQTLNLWKKVRELRSNQDSYFTKMSTGKDKNAAKGNMDEKLENVQSLKDTLRKDFRAAYEAYEKSSGVTQGGQ